MHVLALVSCFLLLFSSPAFGAVASGSSASRSSGSGSGSSLSSTLQDEEEEESYEEYLEREGFYDSVSVDALDSIQADVSDILALLASSSDASKDSVEVDYLEDEQEIEILSNVVTLSSGSLPDHDVFTVTGTFDNTTYTIVFPLEYRPYIWVDSDGVLYNISSSNITGRAFPGGTFDSTSYNYYIFTFRSMLGSNASTIYNYGYLSSLQYYYRSTSGNQQNLTSTTTYGNFYVDEDGIVEYRSLAVDYKSYYVAVVILFVLGGVWLCYWKSSRH